MCEDVFRKREKGIKVCDDDSKYLKMCKTEAD